MLFSRNQLRGSGRKAFWSTILAISVFLGVGTTVWLSLVFSSHRSPCIADNHSNLAPPSVFWSPPYTTLSNEASFSAPPYVHPSLSNNGLAINHLVFGIAGAAQLWDRRKEFIKLWWRREEMRGFVWLEEAVKVQEGENVPPVQVSEDTSTFSYTHPLGHPSGIRLSRIVAETFRLGLPNVRWFVMGDDDTLFNTDNLLRVLSKYDPSEMWYIGSNSESHRQNDCFSHSMAYGGGGFAISYPLAEALAAMQDKCLERYPSLFGSDDRLHACITELGVPLTRESGFHQFDVFGNAHGLLASHPLTPFISMHHLELLDPIFPHMSALDGLRLLTKAMRTEPGSFLQQSIAYDHKRSLSFSISTGYVIQVFPEIILPRLLTRVETTFTAWNRDKAPLEFAFDTRPSVDSVCQKPYLFYLEDMQIDPSTSRVVTVYKRLQSVDEEKSKNLCWSKGLPPSQVESIRVVSERASQKFFSVSFVCLVQSNIQTILVFDTRLLNS
ncbi:hypothetical protein KC19_12G150300 [Ceratodon purpureus]|uniref:Uncharacterized protein n=1 Tax=Ceratodon purpureus TaxID=3225 RepID=A0A8T0G9M9_CERPU|nr:hypothetical protein KC19_12G150300 [Ceratodon purpureus]